MCVFDLVRRGLKPLKSNETEGEKKDNMEREEREERKPSRRRHREKLISRESVGYKDGRCDH